MIFRNIVLVISCSLILSSCYYDVESELYPNQNCNLPEVISYSADVVPVINSNCATSGCHVAGGTGPGNFSNYNELKAKVDNGTFEIELFVDQTMPPNGSVGVCNSQILQAWVDAGALNN